MSSHCEIKSLINKEYAKINFTFCWLIFRAQLSKAMDNFPLFSSFSQMDRLEESQELERKDPIFVTDDGYNLVDSIGR